MNGGWTVGTAPIELRYRLAALAALGIVGISGIVPPPSGRWLSAVIVWGVVVGYARYRLGQNHAPGAAKPDEQLGVANVITVVRGWFVALFFGVVLTSHSTIVPAGIFVFAVLLDAVDGAVARRTKETVLGARLDGATDALALLVGSVSAVLIGVLPAWYVIAGVVWYGYSGSLLFRRRSGSVYPLSESRLRTLIGSAQFLVIAVAVWPEGHVPPTVAAIALFALLVSFARDWATATGRIGGGRRRG